MSYFEKVDPKQSFPKLEENIQKFWTENKIFQKSLDKNKGKQDYVFYDGPPFATGLPHMGHLYTSYIKDLIPRYKTMQGFHVDRTWGWDCHGLPIEHLVEKKLELKNHEEIHKHGVEKFCEECRDNIFTYADEWEVMIHRLGRWVDFDRQYKTQDTTFMESVWWVFKTLYDKGLIYEGSKILPYCTRCVTPLSNFEIKMDDAYRDKQDRTVIAKLKLDNSDASLLIWTTTPWTLPANMAVGVNTEIEYSKVENKEGEILIAATNLLEKLFKDTENYKVLETFQGSSLVGKKYKPLFSYAKENLEPREENKKMHEIIAADFVTDSDGTGLVHLAPAFGEDDYEVCKANDIAFYINVDKDGKYEEHVQEYKGQHIFEANSQIIKDLKEKNLVFSDSTYVHSYPHCWRCDNPLIYKAIGAWFLAVEQIKDQMIANNQQINWEPEYIKDNVMGKWLENARDWCISRNRYWGSVLPVWKCDQEDCKNIEVFGNKKDLENLIGHEITDLHKHIVDKYTYKCKCCAKGTMKRIPEVLDCWFESGSMPYGQLHYPFENKELFEKNFPADFIVEYIGQTRGWFYTLIVLSTALFNKPPFKNVIAHGVIQASDGRKMSKRLKNYTDPKDLLNKYGSDSLRLALMNSACTKGQDLAFKDSSVENQLKKVILALWNSYSFFVTYANIDGFTPQNLTSKQSNQLDQWILSKTQELILEVQENCDTYNLEPAAQSFIDFIDNLNNWYIRRSRRRFWKSENDSDKFEAMSTLYKVLTTLCKVMAPFAPFTTEAIYKNLTKEESIHLADYPKANQNLLNKELNSKTQLIQDVISLGLSIRSRHKIKVRQPLNKINLVINLVHNFDSNDIQTLKEELNVKDIVFKKDYSEFAELKLDLNNRKLGKEYPSQMKDLIKASKTSDYKLNADSVEICGLTLQQVDYSFSYQGLNKDDVEANSQIVVQLDTELNQELINEGYVRDTIRVIQDYRKFKDLIVDQRIDLEIHCSSKEVQSALQEHIQTIQNETLSESILFVDNLDGHVVEVGEFIITLNLK